MHGQMNNCKAYSNGATPEQTSTGRQSSPLDICLQNQRLRTSYGQNTNHGGGSWMVQCPILRLSTPMMMSHSTLFKRRLRLRDQHHNEHKHRNSRSANLDRRQTSTCSVTILRQPPFLVPTRQTFLDRSQHEQGQPHQLLLPNLPNLKSL